MRAWPETSGFRSWTRAEAHAHFESVAHAAETLGVHSLRSIAARGPAPGMPRGAAWLELRAADTTDGVRASIALERVILYVLAALEHAEGPLDRWGLCAQAEIEAALTLGRLPAHIEAREAQLVDEAAALLPARERATAFSQVEALARSIRAVRASTEREHGRAIAQTRTLVDRARAIRAALPDLAPAARRPELTQRDVERAIDAYLASLDGWRASQADGEARIARARAFLAELAQAAGPLTQGRADMRDDAYRDAARRSRELLRALSAPPVPGSPMAALERLGAACE